MSWDQCHLLNACLFMPIMRIPLLSYRLSICLAFPVKAGVINPNQDVLNCYHKCPPCVQKSYYNARAKPLQGRIHQHQRKLEEQATMLNEQASHYTLATIFLKANAASL